MVIRASLLCAVMTFKACGPLPAPEPPPAPAGSALPYTESREPAFRKAAGPWASPWTERVQLAQYIAGLHARLHPVFEKFLDGLTKLPQDDPRRDVRNRTHVTVVIAGVDGRVVDVQVTRPSGTPGFDHGAIDALGAASPYGPPPFSWLGSDGNLRLHYEFYGNPVYGCSTYFVRPLDTKPLKRDQPFQEYLESLHARLLPVFESFRKEHEQPKLQNRAEVTAVISGTDGRVVAVRVTRSSGVGDFDDGAAESFRKSSPFAVPPPFLLASDGNLHLHYEFDSDPAVSCSNDFARLMSPEPETP